MGVVYRAHQEALDRTVAVKVVTSELAADPEFRARFQREARSAAALHHAHIVGVYDAGVEDGRPYLIMQHIDGPDLAMMLREHGAMPPADAVEVVAQIASALDAAHDRGMVHRDVKPANIMVTRAGSGWHAYLTDFGITTQAGDTSLTRAGTAIGTLDYMAPEQLMGNAYDHRVDVYALGAVLYQALTGHVPYPRDTDPARIYAHLNADIPAVPASGHPAVSAALSAVVQGALAKDPDARFASAGALADAARAALRGEPATYPANGAAQQGPGAAGYQPTAPAYRPPSGPVAYQPTNPAYQPTNAAYQQPSPAYQPPSGPGAYQPGGPGYQSSGPVQQTAGGASPSGPGRRALLLAGAGAVVLAGVGAAYAVPRLSGQAGDSGLPDDVPAAKPDPDLPRSIKVRGDATFVDVAVDSAWVNHRQQGMTRIDLKNGATKEVDVGGDAWDFAVGPERVWVVVVGGDTFLQAVDVRTGARVGRISVGIRGAGVFQTTSDGKFGWLSYKNRMIGVDLENDSVAARVTIGGNADWFSMSSEALVVLDSRRRLYRLDPRTGKETARPLTLPNGYDSVAQVHDKTYVGGDQVGFGELKGDTIPEGSALQLKDYYLGVWDAGAWGIDVAGSRLRRVKPDLTGTIGAPVSGLRTRTSQFGFDDTRLCTLEAARASVRPFRITPLED